MQAAFSQKTQNITVEVEPEYLPGESHPEDSYFVWAYHVTLTNHGEHSVQLINRYWKITDGEGIVNEVRGSGVVGEQPVVRPGEAFQYSSGTYLDTPSGIMGGYYEMIDEEGDHFKIVIPTFSLDSPQQFKFAN